jgi:hypothetical protein
MPAPLRTSLPTVFSQLIEDVSFCNHASTLLYWLVPFGLLPFAIGVTTDDSGLSTIAASGFVSGAFRLPLSARLACSTNVSTMEPARRGEGSRFGSFR